MNEIRLQKLLSECGVASRRKAEALIEQGKVKVNGHVAKLGDKVDPRADLVTVLGKRIALPERLRYLMLNKPRGYVTTMNDEKGRKCVAELVADVGDRVFPVGRLDRDSEGLLLLTNDGDFANKIIHPVNHVPKVYRATLRPGISEEQMEQFRSGMMLEGEKRKTAPAEIYVISREKLATERAGVQDERVMVEIILFEGRNRQIRRMFEQMHIEVARLRRVALGNVKVGMLAQGKWRDLDPREIQSLLHASGAKTAESKRNGDKEAVSHGVHRTRR